jgi:hypothetical protein
MAGGGRCVSRACDRRCARCLDLSCAVVAPRVAPGHCGAVRSSRCARCSPRFISRARRSR